MWEQWGVEILAFPLTWHIAYTTATAQAMIFWFCCIVLIPFSVFCCSTVLFQLTDCSD